MKKISLKLDVIIIIICYLNVVFISGCSYSVTRTGYEVDSNPKTISDNSVSVIKYANLNLQAYEKLGEIKLSNNPLGCSESDAIELLKKEAGYLGADIVNIIDEKRPDFINSCYRCHAEFYKTLNSNIKITTSPSFNKENIEERDSEDNAKYLLVTAIGCVAAFFLGRYIAKENQK
jgi:hypothetical protein